MPGLTPEIVKAKEYFKGLLIELTGKPHEEPIFDEQLYGERGSHPVLSVMLGKIERFQKDKNYYIFQDNALMEKLSAYFYLYLYADKNSYLEGGPWWLQPNIYLRIFKKDIDAFNQRYEAYLASKEPLYSEQKEAQKQFTQEIIQGALSQSEKVPTSVRDYSLSDGLSLNDAKNIALTCKAAAEKASDGKQKYQAIIQTKLPLLFIDRVKETPAKTTAINLP